MFRNEWSAKSAIDGFRDRWFEWKMAQRYSLDQPLSSPCPIDAKKLENVAVYWPGKYQWPAAEKWVNSILRGLQKFVRVYLKKIPQPYKGIVVIHWVNNHATHEVAIDYSDYPGLNEKCAGRCRPYFKMQYDSQGYSPKHVVPGGFVPGGNELYRYLPYLRTLRDKGAFSYDVYGLYSYNFAVDVRKRAVDILRRQGTFRYEGGGQTIRYSRYLREIAQSKICIDLPGNGDFCFRLIEYLAVGACIIGPRHRTVLHHHLVDRKHVVFTKDDLTDLVPLCAFYLENDEAREEMCRESRAFFDSYLHRDQLAAYYLETCLKQLC